jgi:predicted nucleic acid-binding protein
MTTFIDSSVLLDILVCDPQFAGASEAALKEARSKGRMVICEAVVAEIRPALSSDSELVEFCDDIGLEFEPCPFDAALLAGTIYSAYLVNRGTAKRVLADFLIAAQASIGGYVLLARDRGYYREYFKELVIADPTRRLSGIS